MAKELGKTVPLNSFRAFAVALTGPFLAGALRASGGFDSALAVDELVAAMRAWHQPQFDAAWCARGDAQGGGPHVDLGCAVDEYVTEDSVCRNIRESAEKWSL